MIRWSEWHDKNCCINQQLFMRKTTEKKKKILEKNNMNTTKTRKKIINNQWIESTSTTKKSRYWNKNIERKNYVFTVKKKTSNQEMQISTKSNTEISKNMNKNNYDNRIMQTRMMSDDDMSTTSFMIESSKKLSVNKQKNKMRIIHTIMKQKQLKISRTW